MKKVFLAIVIACLAMGAWAKEMPKSGLGFQIGWAQPILRQNDALLLPKDSLMNVTKLNGLKVGVVYDATYVAGFGSTVGINYTFAAGHSAWKTTGITNYPRMRTVTTYHEFELFVDWQYKFEVAKETYLMLYTGPSLQYSVAFKDRLDTEIQNFDGSINRTSVLSNRYETSDPLRHLNITWGLGAGFQYQRYFLREGYDFGLINPYKEQKFSASLDDRYTRGRLDQWSIKVGMYLWYK